MRDGAEVLAELVEHPLGPGAGQRRPGRQEPRQEHETVPKHVTNPCCLPAPAPAWVLRASKENGRSGPLVLLSPVGGAESNGGGGKRPRRPARRVAVSRAGAPPATLPITRTGGRKPNGALGVIRSGNVNPPYPPCHRASTATTTRFAPAWRKARAASAAVLPVVSTSSTSRTIRPRKVGARGRGTHRAGSPVLGAAFAPSARACGGRGAARKGRMAGPGARPVGRASASLWL